MDKQTTIALIQDFLLQDDKLLVFLAVAFRVFLILAAIFFLTRLGYVLIDRIVFSKIKGLRENKSITLSLLIKSYFRYFMLFIALIMVLKELDVDYTPILASAGVLGLAIGFGAQNLVRDIITGAFILFEGQYEVGDYITTGSFTGVVEEVGLRITRLRDFSGEKHIIPNGLIETVTNHTQGNMRALIDVDVSYEDDLDKVRGVLEELSEELAAQHDVIKEGPTVLGVQDLGDSGITIRVTAYTEPMSQWSIERVIRKAIKERFDREGIEIPYPRRVLYQREEK